MRCRAFLANNAAVDRKYLATGKLDPRSADDMRADIATIEAGAALFPDVTVTDSRPREALGGLRLRVNLAPNAATAGDA